MGLLEKMPKKNRSELEEELLRQKEIEEKARKRTRGPYRKSHMPASKIKRI
jgi:hypothetical protein